MEKEMLGNMFKYENGKLYKKHKNSKTKWKCYANNKPDGQGYIKCKVNDKFYSLHRLVYLFYNPEWNIYDSCHSNSIDHMNGNKNDNRIENLKLVNNSQNCQNISIRNGKEVKGYRCMNDGRARPWVAYWVENGKQKTKYFETEVEAKDFTEEMRKLHHYRPCSK